MKVKIIAQCFLNLLEDEVNKFIENNNIVLIDFKITANENAVIAAIIYEEDKQLKELL